MAEMLPPSDRRAAYNGVAEEELARMRAEIEELKKREENRTVLAEVVQSSHDSIITIDLQGRITTWNAAAELLYGYPSAEAIGQPLTMLTLPEDLAHVLERIEQIKEKRSVETFDTVRVCKGGQEIWLSITLSPVNNLEGQVVGISTIARDISGRKATEDALRQTDARLQLAQEAGQVGIWSWDLATGESYWSETLWSLFGYNEPPPISPQTAWMQHVDPEDRQRMRQNLASLQASGETGFRDEFRICHRDGQPRWLESVARVVRDDTGSAISMSGVNFDVTGRKRSEAALSASEERLRLVVESAREYAIFSLDLNRTILSWNSGAEAILGYRREEAVGLSADIIFTAEDRAAGAAESEAKTAFFEGRAADERWHVRKDGTVFWGSGVMMAMRNPGGTVIGLVKVFRDETARREAREALEQSRRDLWKALQENERAREEAERARAEAEAAGEAKSHFLAVLSHELRTPLTPVAMVTDILAGHKDLPEPVREALRMIRRNVLLEVRLINDLLDLTKIERGKMELILDTVELHDVVRLAVETTRSDFEAKRQQLTVELASGAHWLKGDAGRLQQVVWNLLKNASKFTSDDGEIIVRTRSENNLLVIEVTDSGIGIDAASLPKVFDAFSQANVSITRQFGGLGLGLAIAHAIVVAHGGELRAASAGAGSGSTFTVSLPVSA